MKRVDILQAVLVTFILVNFTMLYAAANYSDDSSPLNLSDKIWYIVEGGIYPLMSVIFICFNKDRKLKYVWLTLGIFFAIRWVCEIIVFTYNINVNDPKPGIAFLFYLSFAAIVIITFYPYILWLWNKLMELLWKSR